MTLKLNFSTIGVFAILSLALFFALHSAIKVSVPAAFPGDVVHFNLKGLEEMLNRTLGQVRQGQAISVEQEKILHRVKEILAQRTDSQELISALIAMIEEILLLNSELIYLPDGERNSDIGGEQGGS